MSEDQLDTHRDVSTEDGSQRESWVARVGRHVTRDNIAKWLVVGSVVAAVAAVATVDKPIKKILASAIAAVLLAVIARVIHATVPLILYLFAAIVAMQMLTKDPPPASWYSGGYSGPWLVFAWCSFAVAMPLLQFVFWSDKARRVRVQFSAAIPLLFIAVLTSGSERVGSQEPEPAAAAEQRDTEGDWILSLRGSDWHQMGKFNKARVCSIISRRFGVPVADTIYEALEEFYRDGANPQKPVLDIALLAAEPYRDMKRREQN